MPQKFLATHPSGNATLRRTGDLLQLSEKVAGGCVDVQQVSPGLRLIQSEMTFAKDTVFRETYKERDVLQFSFCLQGDMAWDFHETGGLSHRITPAQCSLQCGIFSRCDSCYQAGQTYRSLSVSLERERLANLADHLELTGLFSPGQSITTHVFHSTPQVRHIVQQLLHCPPDRQLKQLYLEGKILELLSTFCTEIIQQKETKPDISTDDYCCIKQARSFIDAQFLHPLTISQVAQACFLSETKLKHGFKHCFGCTVYDYIVDKRMELAYGLLQSGQYRVKDVVWRAGYTNASHFIESFRKKYGITPGEVLCS